MGKTSKAQINASNKYNKEHYAKIQANINKPDYNGFCHFCSISGLSKAQLITRAVRQYIFEEIMLGKWSDDDIRSIAEAFEMQISEIQKIRNELMHSREVFLEAQEFYFKALEELTNESNPTLTIEKD